MDARLAEVQTIDLGYVTDVHMDKQKVTVQPVFRSARLVSGVREDVKVKPIPNVPIAFGPYDTWDVSKGDFGLLLFVQRSIAEWKARGGKDVTPADPRRNDIADAVFLPGLFPFSAPRPEAAWAPGARVIHHDDIRLGSRDATDPLVLTSLLLARLNAIEDKLRTHTHTVSGTCPSGGGSLTAGNAAAPGSIIADTVEADIAATKCFGE
jgi:hypothetical protein